MTSSTLFKGNPGWRWLVGLVGGVSSLVASEIDWGRIDPVPSDQPIPVADFYRPPLFFGPELNPAGTHIAAFYSGGMS